MPIANTTALPEGAPIVGAQVAGLLALALAFVLAVTRLSIRHRPATKPDSAADPANGAKPGTDVKPGTDADPATAAEPDPEPVVNPDADKTDKPADQPDTKEAPPETPDTDEK